MALLCFVLDLRSLALPILRDLKQALLQLANYYAIKFQNENASSGGAQSKAKVLLDRIGLCYVFRNRISCSDELKIAYNPHGNFNLRDLHHAVNNLPTNVFCPESCDSGTLYQKLADFLSEKSVYNWGDQDKSVSRKVILISSCHSVGTMDSMTMKALMNACDKRVLVEFILLEQTSSHLDLYVLYGLAKRWFLELKGDEEEPLQARFIFKEALFSTLNWISCNLCTSFLPIVDDFEFCQTCRCHGVPLKYSNMNHIKSSSCAVNNDNLEALDIFEKSIRVGEYTLLHMPSFHGNPKQSQLSSPIEFNVICRSSLGSLSEGLIMGGTYFVTPSTFSNHVENEKSQLNNHVFQVVCSVLHSVDQGLVCSSNCNIETASVTSLLCYYILLPSDKGQMLLRKLSASEEFLPIPRVGHLTNSGTVQEIENTVQASLLKMEVSEYNPFQYERGFHQKLNLLVKESLQFGAVRPKGKDGTTESNSNQQNSEVQPTVQAACTDKLPHLNRELGEKKTIPSLTEEWEQLIVTELGSIHSPTCISSSKQDQPVASPSQTSRQLDEKTSRILERLEAPRQLKRKTASPTLTTSLSADVCALGKKPLILYDLPTRKTASPPLTTSLSADVCVLGKKPLIPYDLLTDTVDQAASSSQPMKPNFQRIKRKR